MSLFPTQTVAVSKAVNHQRGFIAIVATTLPPSRQTPTSIIQHARQEPIMLLLHALP
jgi:hypothetical protein